MREPALLAAHPEALSAGEQARAEAACETMTAALSNALSGPHAPHAVGLKTGLTLRLPRFVPGLPPRGPHRHGFCSQQDPPMQTTAPDPPPTPTPVRYDYLDALRGLAILGVMAVHAVVRTGHDFPGGDIAFAGRYGVQLFFMVSAFTIFLTLDRARWNGWWTCSEFFIRRFFRILPMFWVGLALYAFVPGRSPESSALTFTPLDYLLTACLQHGWRPALINSLVPGGWSIAVEGTFYLLAPLCFRVIRTWQAALWLLLGSLALCEFSTRGTAALYFGGHLFAGSPLKLVDGYFYCWFPAQLPVFACGMLTYHLARTAGQDLRGRSSGAPLLAASAVWVLASINVERNGWIGGPVCCALGFVPLILGLKIWPARFLVNPATRFLGKVSYSAYLLHFAVLKMASDSLNTFLEPDWQTGPAAFALLYAATLLGTAPLAWLAYRYVERPCINLGARLIRHRRAKADSAASAPAPWPLAGVPRHQKAGEAG